MGESGSGWWSLDVVVVVIMGTSYGGEWVICCRLISPRISTYDTEVVVGVRRTEGSCVGFSCVVAA